MNSLSYKKSNILVEVEQGYCILSELQKNGVSAEDLGSNVSSILNLHNSSITPDNLLQKAMFANIRDKEGNLDQHKIALQKEVMRYTLGLGASLNDGQDYLSIRGVEIVELHKELFFQHVNDTKFLINLCYIKNEAGKERIMREFFSQPRDIDISAWFNKFSCIKTIDKLKDTFFGENSNFTEPEEFLGELITGLYDGQYEELVGSIGEYAVSNGINVNAKYEHYDEYHTLFEFFYLKDYFDLIDLSIEEFGAKNLTLSFEVWLNGIEENFSNNYFSKAISRFPQMLDYEKISEFLVSMGMTRSAVDGILDVLKLSNDFVKTINGDESSLLSNEEVQILNTTNKNISVATGCDEYKNIYGFGTLSLALLAENFNLAEKLVKDGVNILAKSRHGLTPMQIMNFQELNAIPGALVNATLERIDNVDLFLNDRGETLIDNFIEVANIKDIMLDKTNDLLFSLLKPGADLLLPSKNTTKINIGISISEHTWSSGHHGTTRLIKHENPDVDLYLVNINLLEQGGDSFISQFDGWLNPGGGDSFPKDKKEFNKTDWQQIISIEKMYQQVLNFTGALKMPYLGICAGSQNLVLYQNGSLQPLQNYSSGKHNITFVSGGFTHYYAMNPKQQQQALEKCEFPKVSLLGETAHNYAAVNGKLGDEIVLGAVSEDDIPMAYTSANGLRIGMQFHPEHYYSSGDNFNGAVNYQKMILNNFIYLAKLHHEHRVNNASHPEDIMHDIKSKLADCLQPNDHAYEHVDL